jgi:hypothetical protein
MGEPLDGDSELGKAIDGFSTKLAGAVAPDHRHSGVSSFRPATSPA